MISESIEAQRCKHRRVVEIRYPHMYSVFDRRGKVLEILHESFKGDMEHWRTGNAELLIANDFNCKTAMIHVTHHRAFIAYEDELELERFMEYASRFLRLFLKVFPEVKMITRVGVRFISIYKPKHATSYSSVLEDIRSTYLASNKLVTVEPTDVSITYQHKRGRFQVGPARKGEEWVNGTFEDKDTNVPDCGYGIDVDSYIPELPLKAGKEIDTLLEAVETAADMSRMLELEVVTPLKILDPI